MKHEIQDNYNGALQQPINSGFGEHSTTSDVIKGIDLRGKTAIVTGGYAGIGLETTITLINAGAEVWVPARSIEKAKSGLNGLANVRIEAMDLTNPQSIDSFAQKFISEKQSLDLLINNAGIMWVPLRRDSRGNESQFSTNHLGHFQLTATLWPVLKSAQNARIVNVSSFGHQIAPFNFEDANFENRAYETLQGYGQSKTANNLFTVELDHRAKHFGIRAYSAHPGSVYGTDLGREASMHLFQQMGTHDQNGNIFPEVEKKLKTIPQGAATTVWCATSPSLNQIGGVYCNDVEVAILDSGQIEHVFSEPSSLHGVKPYSLDAKSAKKLWELSEKLTQISFPVN